VFRDSRVGLHRVRLYVTGEAFNVSSKPVKRLSAGYIISISNKSFSFFLLPVVLHAEYCLSSMGYR